MEIEKSKVSIQFVLIFRQSGDVLFFLYARRFRGYTATGTLCMPSQFILLWLINRCYLINNATEVRSNEFLAQLFSAGVFDENLSEK